MTPVQRLLIAGVSLVVFGVLSGHVREDFSNVGRHRRNEDPSSLRADVGGELRCRVDENHLTDVTTILVRPLNDKDLRDVLAREIGNYRRELHDGPGVRANFFAVDKNPAVVHKTSPSVVAPVLVTQDADDATVGAVVDRAGEMSSLGTGDRGLDDKTQELLNKQAEILAMSYPHAAVQDIRRDMKESNS